MLVRQLGGLAIVVGGLGSLLALGSLAPVGFCPDGVSGSCGSKGACGTSGCLGLPVELPGCCPGTLSEKENSLMLPSSASSPNQCNLSKPPEGSKSSASSTPKPSEPVREVQKSDQEWRKLLTPLQYQVTRQKGTERAFTGEYWNCTKPGVYRCICCGAELFSSEAKFLSKSGWPSFWQAIRPEAVETRPDHSHGMIRTEVLCRRCGAHLGHVFDDGPQPTGLRYCINSAALRLEEKTPDKKPFQNPRNNPTE